jgi:ABC-type lipoprotein export system ATPase subunit
MDNKLIRINNLSCSYTLKEKDKVLFIENLDIDKGKVVFLLGSSGSGKSTLLETIGLMNNTIVSGSILWYNGNEVIDFTELWKDSKTDKINQVRRKHLSFIFQNTNLMENFTAYENICLSQMIKNNVQQSDVIANAQLLMEQIGLPLSQVGINTLSVNLSGGQRQRVSFVRALNNEFQILLCDEPTGNLDEVNADELLLMVKQNIGNNRSALVVSHDINLALKYADQIVLITKNQQGFGEILTQFIFEKSQWINLEKKELQEFRESLVDEFKSEKSVISSIANDNATLSKKITYRKLFLNKESKVLFGKSNVNWLILVFILTFTFVAIGFANGTLNYLNKKLDDAFVNWLAILIPSSKSDQSQVEEFASQLNDSVIKENYSIKSVTIYKEFSLPFYGMNKDGTLKQEVEFIKGRLLMDDRDGESDPIATDLFGPKNWSYGDTAFKGGNDVGIVVTESLMEYLGYPRGSKIIYFDNNEKDTSSGKLEYFKVPVPIRAVIKDIPNRNKFITTEYFYKSYITHQESVFDFGKDNRKKISLFVEGSRELLSKTKEAINEIKNKSIIEEYQRQNYLEDSQENANSPNAVHKLAIDVFSDTCYFFNVPGYILTIEFDPIPKSYVTTERVFNEISELQYFKSNKNKVFRILDYNNSGSQGEIRRYDFLSVNFKKNGLDKIDDFAKYLNKNLNTGKEGEQSNVIEIDSGKIQEKKNFLYISNMTLLITILLIIFSILSISLFVSNLLKTHLNKVKMNLGTYKAFGLSNRESIQIYLTIMLRFILFGILVALIISFGLGFIINLLFESQLSLEDSNSYFILNSNLTYLLVLIIIAITVLVSFINIKRILSKTPGDLIYNR